MGQLFVLMEALNHKKREFGINFTKANTKFLWVDIIMVIIVIRLLMEEI